MLKHKSLKFVVLVLIFLLFLNSAVWAIELPDYTGDIYVQDFANMVSPQLENKIKNAARMLEDQTSAQISIVTINSLEGIEIETYANELFRKWGLGDKEKENGVLFLIAKEEQKFRIEVGYGLEGQINDAKAGDILRTIVPYFQKGDFETGISQVFNNLVKEISFEYNSDQPANKSVTPQDNVNIPWWAQVLILGIIVYLAIFHPELLMAILYVFSRNGGGSGGSRRGGGGSSGGGGASGGW